MIRRVPIELLIVVLFAVVQNGCISLRVPAALKSTPMDWTQSGGGPSKINYINDSLELPLEKRWDYNSAAGFGAYALTAKGGDVFITNLQGDLQSLDISTGKEVGSVSLGSSIFGPAALYRNIAIIAGAAVRDNLVNYDLLSGSRNWTCTVGPVESAPLLYGESIICSNVLGVVTSVHRDLGKQEWADTLPKPSHGAPVTDGSSIYVCCDDGNVRALDPSNGSIRWTASTDAPIFGGAIVVDSLVVVGTMGHLVYAIHHQTGKIIWKTNVHAAVYGAASSDRKRIYIGTTGGRVYALNAVDGTIMWNHDIGGVVSAAPLILGNDVVVVSYNTLLRVLDCQTGEKKFELKFDAPLRTTPLYYNGNLLVAAGDRSIYCYSRIRK